MLRIPIHASSVTRRDDVSGTFRLA
jgi:hypothetical protein